MKYLLYDVATTVAAPALAAWLAVRRKHRPLLGRLVPSAPDLSGKGYIWVQACSVGEVGTALPMVAALRARLPDRPILLTTSTVTGHALAEKRLRDAALAWFPFDHRWSVNRFLEQAAPAILVLVETELWPNVIRLAAQRGVPVVIVNGRISDKHIDRYRRFKWFLRPVFASLSAVGMQNSEYAERAAELGVPESSIYVTGNTKFDGVVTELDASEQRALREEMGLAPDEPVLVFGSTRPGDEELAARCWAVLRDEFPRLRLVLAPRHLDRLREALAPFDGPILHRSQVKEGRRSAGERVLVVDTLGELVRFYGLATVAVIGGSFYRGVNGHNPLESAALGVPTVFGPFMRNFTDPARVLVEARGACQVDGPDALLDELRGLLSAPENATEMAQRGREAIAANQGAIARNVDLIADALRAAAGDV